MAVIYVGRTPRKESSSARGDKIKKVGIAARHDIEKFFGKKVFLELFVKVEERLAQPRQEIARVRLYGMTG